MSIDPRTLRPPEVTPLLLTLAKSLARAAITGTPIGKFHMHWMQDVQPGDLVIVRHVKPDAEPWQRIGYLLKVEDEIRRFSDDDPETYTERIWTILTTRGEFRWFNVAIDRIPANEHQEAIFNMLATRCVLANCLDCARVEWKDNWPVRVKAAREP